MGFLSASSKAKVAPAGTTVIAVGTRVDGELKPTGNLRLEGILLGSVDSAADVFIGPEGSFEGTLRARSVRVSGHARGNMQCEHLEILPGGIVTGEVDAQALIITPGGRFLGESVQRGAHERALAVAVAS